MSRYFRLYVPGATEIAGVRILAIANSADSKTRTLYSIRYKCCNKLDTLSHRDIELRHKAGAKYCAKCARIHNGRLLNGISPTTPYVKKEFEFIVPPWPIASNNGDLRELYPHQV